MTAGSEKFLKLFHHIFIFFYDLLGENDGAFVCLGVLMKFFAQGLDAHIAAVHEKLGDVCYRCSLQA